MNKYEFKPLSDLDDADDLDNINSISKVKKQPRTSESGEPGGLGNPGRSNRSGRKLLVILLLVLAVAAPVMFYLFSETNVKAEAEKIDKNLIDSMLNELQEERALLEHEKQKLADRQDKLKAFESELDKRYSEYLRREQQLAAKEIDFNNKVDMRIVDRQTIETYESIDSEQAAVLLRNMYEKDPELATLIIKRISGKKAGRILEAMIPIDREVSTKIAQDALNYYRIK
jgi:flagellar motility protein MotE (MotC chaperone)